MRIDPRQFVFTGRGSSALYAILIALEKKGGRILLPVNICEIVIPVIESTGMTCVFYDVNILNGLATLDHINKAYTGNEDVLIAVHNFGAPLEIDIITQWAANHNVFLIEDVCNAAGASYKGTELGLWGDAAIFSFGYVKILEYGFGGACHVKDDMLKNNIKKLIDTWPLYGKVHDEKNQYYQKMVSLLRKDLSKQIPAYYTPLYQDYVQYLIYRISKKSEADIIKLWKALPENISERRRKASLYRNGIENSDIQHPQYHSEIIYWRYNLLVNQNKRDLLLAELRKADVLCSTWYPPIAHLFNEKYIPFSFPEAHGFAEKVLNLFVDFRVNDTNIQKTIDIINHF